MRKFYWGTAALFLGLLSSSTGYAANVCQMADGYLDKGIGGTGISSVVAGLDNNKGIGGTGVYASHDQNGKKGGIGGTGLTSDVATVYVSGTLYAFGSLCVNGLRIAYDSKTPTTEGGETSSPQKIRLGQVVQVFAEKRAGESVLHARQINIDYAVHGAISHLDIGRGQINVMGAVVHTSPELITRLHVGETISVSGLREPSGAIVASAITTNATPVEHSGHLLADAAAHANYVSIEGYVSHDHSGALHIDDHVVMARDTRGWRDGERVFASGIVNERGAIEVWEHIERHEHPIGLGDRFDGAGHGHDAGETHAGGSEAGRVEAIERSDSVEKGEATEKAERLEPAEKAESAERVEKIERVESVEKVEKIEKVETIEKVEKPEKIDKIEKIDRPELEDHGGGSSRD